MFTREFWMDAAERAIKTGAQTLILVWPVGDTAFNLWEVNALDSLGVALGGVVLSLLSSLASGHAKEGSASALKPKAMFTAQDPPA